MGECGRGPTEGPSGRVHMRPCHSFRHTPHAIRGPIGTSTERPCGRAHAFRQSMSTRPSQKVRCHIGSSTERPSWKVHMRPRR
eukprot:1480540-Pyramimonas_sp.AAC.1